MKKDIENSEDIRRLVDNFYAKVREDDLLGTVFAERINEWSKHLETMYGFWQTVLFGDALYKGSPFVHHAGLPVSALHFERWLELFNQTLDEFFQGRRTEEARWRAEKMAQLFKGKLERINGSPGNRML